MSKENIEQYTQVLEMAASLLETLNKRKQDKDITAVIEELRKISAELLDSTDEVQTSKNLIQRLISFIKSISK